MINGWLLTIEGYEYAFGDANTGGVYSASSADWSSAWTVLPGTLNLDQAPNWSERARSDGSFECGSIDFVLEDDFAPSGSVADKNVCTALFTRSPTLLASTRLAASADASVGTLTVESWAALGLSTPCTVYCELEAIRIQSVVGNVLTVAGGGRGYFGTVGAAHVVDAEAHYLPEVWAAVPFPKGRRAILWAATDAGAVTPVWRGVVAKTRLNSDRARFVVSCESIWTLHAGAPLGEEYATTRFRGFNVNALAAYLRADSGAPVGTMFRPWDGPYGLPVITSSLSEACSASQQRIRSQLTGAGFTSTNARVAVDGGGVVFRIDAAGGVSNAEVTLRVGTQIATGRTTESSGTRRAEARVEGAPPILVAFAPTYDGNLLPITTTSRLPTSWAAVPGLATYAGQRTTITPVLRGALDGDNVVDVYVGSLVASGTHAGTPAPLIVGTARVIPRDGAPPRITNTGPWQTQYVDTDVLLKVGGQVVTDHWAAGLACAIGETAVLRSQVTTRDWDFSTIPGVIGATINSFSRRTWVFDGSLYLGDLLKEELLLNGCALSLRGSRLAFVAIGSAAASNAPVATLGELDVHEDEIQDWERLDEELITAVEVDVDGTTLRVNDTRARGRYGRGRTVQVKWRGRDRAQLAAADPLALASALLARVVGPWSEPVGMLTFPVVASEWLDRIYIGDYVDVSEWVAPDGAGARGVGSVAALAAAGELSARAQVIGRQVDLGRNMMRLELLLFPQVYGYAPCGRIENSDTADSINVLVGWLNAVGDYTNPAAGAADGGAARFKVGDRVLLILRDSTTETVVGPYEVQAIAANTITFTTSIDAAARASINGGAAWWDVIPAKLSDIDGTPNAAAQLSYAYCGSLTDGYIGGLAAYPNRPWAP